MKFTDVCDLLIPRMDADAVLLKDGRVFIVGGFVINDESEATKTAEIFNPMTEKCVMSKSEIPVPRGIAGMSACRDNSDTFVLSAVANLGFGSQQESKMDAVCS